MLYLSVPPKAGHEAALVAAGVGLMLTPKSGVRIDLALRFPAWAADNGCFSQGDAFDLDAYFAWLEQMRPVQDRCLFAPAPDVVGDAPATWERGRNVLPAIRALGYRAAYVAQDGIEDLPIEWDAFDVLFIGGSTAWKLSEAAYAVIREAKRQQKHVHYGRLNSWRRYRAAMVAGCDSADGTTLRFNVVRYVPEIASWMERAGMQPALPGLWESES